MNAADDDTIKLVISSREKVAVRKTKESMRWNRRYCDSVHVQKKSNSLGKKVGKLLEWVGKDGAESLRIFIVYGRCFA